MGGRVRQDLQFSACQTTIILLEKNSLSVAKAKLILQEKFFLEVCATWSKYMGVQSPLSFYSSSSGDHVSPHLWAWTLQSNDVV